MTSGTDRPPGRLLLWAGLGLAALGIVAFLGRVSFGRLTVPWYMPALSMMGVGLVAVSLWRRRTAWRGAALAGVVLLAGLETAFLVAVGLPPYEGPIEVGRPFPTFATSRADGTRFTQDDLIGGRDHVLVFFRGRW